MENNNKLGLGLVFGVTFGIIFNNLALGICFGLLFGVIMNNHSLSQNDHDVDQNDENDALDEEILSEEENKE